MRRSSSSSSSSWSSSALNNTTNMTVTANNNNNSSSSSSNSNSNNSNTNINSNSNSNSKNKSSNINNNNTKNTKNSNSNSNKRNAMRLTSYERIRRPHTIRHTINSATIHIEWIANELNCGLCQNIIQNAMVIRNCMHRFCADCILAKIHIGAKKCPLCKKILPKKTPLKSDANFDSVINKFAMTSERKRLRRSISESNTLCLTKRRHYSCDKNTTSSKTMDNNNNGKTTDLSSILSLTSKVDASNEMANIHCNNSDPTKPMEPHLNRNEAALIIDENINNNDNRNNLSQENETNSTLDRFDDQHSNRYHSSDYSMNETENTSDNTSLVMITKTNGTDQATTATNTPINTGRLNNGNDILSRIVDQNIKYIPIQLQSSSNQPSFSSMSNESKLASTINGVILAGCINSTNDPTAINNNNNNNSTKEISMEYFYLPSKQRLCNGLDSELILYPDISVILDKKLPIQAKRPRFIITYPFSTVAHLCEYLMQRMAIESGSNKLKKRRVLICAAKSDLAMDDVIFVNETSEGQFSTLNIENDNINSHFTSVFTITLPFNALDDTLTVEKIRNDYWNNKKRPLRLIFKFVSANK